MERAFVLTVWITGLAAGIATWWALLAWLGPAVLLAPLALAGAVAVGGTVHGRAPRGLRSSPMSFD
jgi:hypothetical protein